MKCLYCMNKERTRHQMAGGNCSLVLARHAVKKKRGHGKGQRYTIPPAPSPFPSYRPAREFCNRSGRCLSAYFLLVNFHLSFDTFPLFTCIPSPLPSNLAAVLPPPCYCFICPFISFFSLFPNSSTRPRGSISGEYGDAKGGVRRGSEDGEREEKEKVRHVGTGAGERENKEECKEKKTM